MRVNAVSALITSLLSSLSSLQQDQTYVEARESTVDTLRDSLQVAMNQLISILQIRYTLQGRESSKELERSTRNLLTQGTNLIRLTKWLLTIGAISLAISAVVLYGTLHGIIP